MNWLDLIFVIILLWAVRSGWDVGLIREVFTLAGLAIGLVMAGQLFRPFADLLSGPEPSNLEYALSFLVVVVVIWFCISFLGRLVRETVHWVKLGWLDRIAGLLFGFLKGVIVIEIFIIVFARFPILNVEALIQGSLVATWISRYAPAVMALLPPDFQQLQRILR